MATTSPSLSPWAVHSCSAVAMLSMASAVLLATMCTWAMPKVIGSTSLFSPPFWQNSSAFSWAFRASSATPGGAALLGLARHCSMSSESWMEARRHSTVDWLGFSPSSCTRARHFFAARSAEEEFPESAWTSATSKSERASQRLSFSFWKMNWASVDAETAWSSSWSTRKTVLITRSARPSACLSPDFVSSSLASLADFIASANLSFCMWTVTARWCADASSAGSSMFMHTGIISFTHDSASLHSLRSHWMRPIVWRMVTSSLRSFRSRARESASSARGSALSASFSSTSVLASRLRASASRFASPDSRKLAKDFLTNFTPASGSLFFT
mmetsp:Transcript_102639/g.319846  ORF Transcript_102639/g.319846 Transcript_102639/m.319846 type:complete len:329 (+) Transcript_102639:779-1765(+)